MQQPTAVREQVIFLARYLCLDKLDKTDHHPGSLIGYSVLNFSHHRGIEREHKQGESSRFCKSLFDHLILRTYCTM